MQGAEKSSLHSRDATGKARESTIKACPACGATWPIVPAPPREGFYFRARAWVAASPRVRAAISKDRACAFRRITALGDTWGLRLDELGASYRMVRWAGSPRFVTQREARYRALVLLLEEHGQAPDVGKRFVALAKEMPAVGRWAKRRESPE